MSPLRHRAAYYALCIFGLALVYLSPDWLSPVLSGACVGWTLSCIALRILGPIP